MINIMENLRKEEIKELYNKLTPYVSKRLWWLNKVEKWTLNEIYEKCGLLPNRLSELIHFRNYKKDVLIEQYFLLLVEAGMVDVKDLLSKTHLTPREENYMYAQTFCAYPGFKETIFKLVSKYNIKPIDVLKEKLEELENVHT